MPETRQSALKVSTPSDLEIEMTRTFDAPRELVFEAHSTCEHLLRWWGRRGSTLSVCDLDFRPGGKWRIISHAPNGEFVFIGEYREVAPFDRFITTFGMENMFFGKTLVETHTFEEENGITHYKSVSNFDTIEDRDGMVASGMEKGMVHGFAVIDDILAELMKG